MPPAHANAAGVVSVCDEAHLRAALSGGGTVTFSCSGYIGLANTITISKDTTIDGSGQSVTISGNSAVRVFVVNSGISLTLNALNVAWGYDGSNIGGGALFSDGGKVTITNCLLHDNNAAFVGGAAVIEGGTLTVRNSDFSGNSAAAGGAIITADATVIVSDSTLDTNSATGSQVASADGGGIYSLSGELTVSNSTFAWNTAGSDGGGILGDNSSVTVINCTFSHNSAGSGGNAIENAESGVIELRNTIVAYSESGTNCSGTITDGGGNLSYPDTSCPGINRNPLLQSLNDNGGPTFTMLLGLGSPAIDAGKDATCAAPPINNLDQRGIVRPQGAHCDIGAVEQQPYSGPPVLKVPNDYPTIQEAVDAAAEGEGVWVAKGVYQENVAITKGLSLIGGWNALFKERTPGDSVIDGQGAGRVISITTTIKGAVVTIDGFTIQNGDASGLGVPDIPGAPQAEPEDKRAKAGNSAQNPDLRSPTERAAELQARLADLKARGLIRGGPAADQAMGARLQRLTLRAEEARAHAEAVAAQPQIRPQQYEGSGGGVYSENAGLHLLNCTITGNTASQSDLGLGGGVYVTGAPKGELRIADNDVNSNVGCTSGDSWGGGIYVANAPGGVIEGNAIENNVATYNGNGYGGGLYVYESADAHIQQNRIGQNLGTDSGQGTDGIAGGLGVENCPGATVHDNLLASNIASGAWNGGRGIGGGLFVTGCNKVDVRDNTVRENLALLSGQQGRGGGIQFMWSDGAVVAGNEISGNLAALYSGDAQGGGIKAGAVYSTSLTGNQILDNAAVVYGDINSSSFGHYGGGLHAVAFEKSLLGDNVIEGNAVCYYCPHGGGFGGGAIIEGSNDAVASGNTIADNAGAFLDGVGVGGGLLLRDTTGSQVLRNRITGNSAGLANSSNGGGLALDHLEEATARAVMDGNVITDNWASGDPAAASSDGGGTVAGMDDGLTFINNVVAGNHAAEVGGFDLAYLPEGGTVVNNTIAGNDDAGLLVVGSVVTLTNNIVVKNATGLRVAADATATLSYTLWYGNDADTGGDGVVDQTHPVVGHPAFVDPSAGDYHLTIASAARDAGDPAGVPPAPDHDADGVARPQGPAVDLGAYEWTGCWVQLPLVLRN